MSERSALQGIQAPGSQGAGTHFVRRGSGVPVLFVHGNGVDHRMLLELDTVFEQIGGWERIHFDLPGFGRTPALPAPGGLPEIAEWLEATARDLLGERHFAVVGASLGALLTRELAARLKEQCLGFALLAPVVDSVRDHRTLPEPAVLVEDAALLRSLDPADAVDYAELAVIQSPENWQRFRDAVLPGVRAADERAMDRLAQRYALPTLPDAQLEGFDKPVLIVAGRQDAVVGFHDQWVLSQRFPHATFAVLDRAGHNISIDQPEAVAGLLARWAEQVAERADNP
ncbi:alpha/beta hydrolase [Demequina sp. TTPB684]|uniref:alpha/beta fold hydrolase n=1 Tax=unclassified Demequina TaxID=2620311 RepID=UPI001CF3060A|nr:MULTISPECIES: alpha/beta hydrolase [unclassified Demequina]MCB2411500.1 alpha/beta hydrolase [Demequina sp. TTPB684]UPU87313.1 alpha/beta hydrolase [Demequina sp. TMPB413]